MKNNNFLKAAFLVSIALAAAPQTHAIILNASGTVDIGPVGQIIGPGNGTDTYTHDTAIVNGGLFSVDAAPGGTGTFDTFLRLQAPADGFQQGMNDSNLDKNANNNNEKSGAHTHDIQFSAVPFSTLDGQYAGSGLTGNYAQIRFDINESQNNGGQGTVEFSEFQVWVSATDPTHFAAPADNVGADDYTNSLGTLVYDLDGGGDTTLRVGESNSGSGVSDGIFFLSLDAILDAVPSATSDYYVSVWVSTINADAGFEELSLLEAAGSTAAPGTTLTYLNPGDPLSTVPEPSSYAFIASLFAALTVVSRRRPR
ncbi:MAG: hypothetical protein ACSHYA_06880 [Opitutaceae bacterium]